MKKIVGVVNFSTLCKKNSGAFISSRENEWESHVATILHPERLDLRLKLFTEISLPMFDYQTIKPHESWFRLVVIISNLLPKEIKKQLEKASELRPWLILEERTEEDWLDAPGAIRRALGKMLEDEDQSNVVFASFRLDDDDFISSTFLDDVRKYTNEENVQNFITFSNGYKCVWQDDKVSNIAPISKPLIAIGLTYIGLYDNLSDKFLSTPETVFAGVNHYDIGTKYGVIDNAERPAFVWSQHGHQDTAGRFKSVEISESWDKFSPEIIESLFGFPFLIPKIKL